MSEQALQQTGRWRDVALIVLFVAALCLPVLGMLFRVGAAPNEGENRPPTPFPKLSLDRHRLGSFPAEFKSYFEDNFAFRNRLINWQAVVKVKWLGVSSSQSVILGKDGWLYFTIDHSLDSYRGEWPFTPEQLRKWQEVLEARRDWLARRGIKYLFVVPPDKHTVYPEYMPDEVVRGRGETRLDQLVRHLREHSDFRIIDLRAPLLEAKGRNRLYHRTDSHWNEYGAFVGYERVMAELTKSFPAMRPLTLADFDVVVERTPGMGLADMLGLHDDLVEDRINLRPRVPLHQIPGCVGCRNAPLVSEGKPPELPRLVMLRDSFADNLIPYLDQHFSRAVYVFNYERDFSTGLIEAERPDVVIQEMLERYFNLDPPAEALSR